jgi:hypothetical protein
MVFIVSRLEAAEPDCVEGGASIIPDCNDPSLAQFAQTCYNALNNGL